MNNNQEGVARTTLRRPQQQQPIQGQYHMYLQPVQQQTSQHQRVQYQTLQLQGQNHNCQLTPQHGVQQRVRETQPQQRDLDYNQPLQYQQSQCNPALSMTCLI